MTDLILHIGLPKCMSSTLQKEILSQEDGYFGTFPGLPWSENYAKQIQEFTPAVGRQTYNRRKAAEWATRLKAVSDQRYPNIERLILSNEDLSASSRFYDRPITRFISDLDREFWPCGQVKVLLVFRRQVDRLLSEYALNSANRLEVGPPDLMKFVMRRLQRYPSSFDYTLWIEELSSAIGMENICALFLEESHTEEFWGTLKDFAQLSVLDVSKADIGSAKRNKRKLGAASWAIAPFDPKSKARQTTMNWMNLIWPRQIMPGPRGRVTDAVISRLASLHQSRLDRWNAGNQERATEITVPGELNSIMKAHVGENNHRLATLLSKDLGALGYY